MTCLCCNTDWKCCRDTFTVRLVSCARELAEAPWVPREKWWCGGWQRPSTAVISSWSDGWMYSNMLFPVSSTCSTHIPKKMTWPIKTNHRNVLNAEPCRDEKTIYLPGTGRGGLMLFQKCTWFCRQRQRQTQSHPESDRAITQYFILNMN